MRFAHMSRWFLVAGWVVALVTACARSDEPDMVVTFTEGGCTLSVPGKELPNPIDIQVDNPTSHDYAVVIAIVEAGTTPADLEAWRQEGVPPLVDRMLAHLDPGPGEAEEWTIALVPDRENFFICAEPAGVLGVPGVFSPGEPAGG